MFHMSLFQSTLLLSLIFGAVEGNYVRAKSDFIALNKTNAYYNNGSTMMYDFSKNETMDFHELIDSSSVDSKNDLVSRALQLSDWSTCSSSSQCSARCCSSKYSNGVLKCTPLGSNFNPSANGCVSASQLLSDWSTCSSSSQCSAGCCSSKYSNGVLKCTPLGSNFNPSANGCVSAGSPVAPPVAPPVARPVAPPVAPPFSFPAWRGNDKNGKIFELPAGLATYGDGSAAAVRWLPTNGCTGMDGAQYKWELNPACNAHDVCFYCRDTPGWGLNKDKCTDIMLNNAHAICDEYGGDWWNKGFCKATVGFLNFGRLGDSPTGDCVNGPHKIPYDYAVRPIRVGFPGNVCNGTPC